MKSHRVGGKKLSVIVPAYKAQRFIKNNLLKIKKVLDETVNQYEIICVVDGRNIDRTLLEAKKAEKLFPKKISIYSYKKNLGKGHAVRYGFARATGDIIAFIDAGIELNPNGLQMLLAHFEWYKADIIVGSKRHQASKVVYPWQRKIMSFIYQILVRILFDINIKDTQVGMKFFRREVLEKVTPRLLVKQFAFDIEILAVANRLGFKRIYEAPVELKMRFSGPSTIITKKFFKIVFLMVWDTIAVFYRLKIINFYDYSNRKNWLTKDSLILKTER